MYLWLRAFTLEISSRQVTYATLFSGRKSILLEDIAKLEWKLWYGQGEQITKPPIRLQLIPTPGTGARALIINAKVFDPKELAQFARLVEQHINTGRREAGASTIEGNED